MQVCKKTVYVALTEADDLKSLEGRTFSTKKNNQETLVTLVKVGNRDVQLAYTKETRQDRFTLSQAKFRKYYNLLSSVKVPVDETIVKPVPTVGYYDGVRSLQNETDVELVVEVVRV